MPFWSSETLASRLPSLVSPFSPERIVNASYELSLGTDCVVTGELPVKRSEVAAGDHLYIPPGQFADVFTEEAVKVPADALALISVKYRYKKRGLVNISGFHADPGYEGALRFSLHNAGPLPVILKCGAPTFLIWYASLDRETEDRYSEGHVHHNQDGFTEEDLMNLQGEVMSPQALDARIVGLSQRIDSLLHIVLAFGAALGSILLMLLVTVAIPYAFGACDQGGSATEKSAAQGTRSAAEDGAETSAAEGGSKIEAKGEAGEGNQ